MRHSATKTDDNVTDSARQRIGASIASFFHRRFGPGFANGIGIDVWLKLLVENRFRIGLPHLGRVATITAASCLNSLGGIGEQILFGEAIRQAKVSPPLFVLGAARSGTSHLHTLLAQDDRFSFPNTFQALNPRIFLTTEWWFAPIQDLLIPSPRPMDNMAMNAKSPIEDEFAIMGLSAVSPFCGWVFPRNNRQYDRYWDLSQASDEERERWKLALMLFLRKLQCRDQRPLILKSPSHTPRIALLLELFPDAKFVHIHRHPYQVYASMLNLARKVIPISTVQHWDMEEESRRALQTYRLCLDGYLDNRGLIPDGNLVDIGFQQLEESPVATIRHVYEQLSLPDFETTRQAVTAYLETIRDYRKNTYAELNSETKEVLKREWSRSFTEWNYAT